MRMQFDRSVLQRELQAVQAIAGKTKTTLPALSHVLMERSAAGCTISATDLSIATRSTCTMTQSDLMEGAVLLPSGKLYEIVQALPTGADVIIEYDDKQARVSCAGFTSKLNVMPASEFPTLPELPVAPSLTLPRAVLREMVRKTSFAVSKDDTRFYLAGAQLSTTGSMLRMVATDGHRLTIFESLLEAEAGQTILPIATMRELAAMTDGDGADIVYTRGENHLFFQCGPRLLVSRLIDGQFPSWDKIVPKGNNKRAVIQRGPWEEALQRVSIMADMRSRAVKMSLDGPQLKINSQSTDSGEAADSVAQQYDGTPITMTFNARYMLDFLHATDGDTVSLELRDEVSQAVLKTIGAEGYDYTYVLMPMRV